MDTNQWIFVITVLGFLLFSRGVFSRTAGYRRRARTDCYLPTGTQYDRSMYLKVYSRDRAPLSPGDRISKGERVMSVCKKDIQDDAILHSSFSRCIYGKWRPPLPDCIALQRCGNAPEVPNTQASEIWQPSKTYPHDYVVTYTCNADLFLVGDNKIQCKNGTWTDMEFSCSEPGDPEKCRQKFVTNGFVWERTTTTYEVTCDKGFELEGEQNIFTCNNGEWIGVEPQCNPRVCPSLSHVSYDIISSPLQHVEMPVYGSTVRVWCPAGQAPYRDVNTASCMDGTWEPFRPFCRRYCTIQQQYQFYSRFTYLRTSMTVKDKVGHGQKVLQRCLGESKTTKHRCLHGRWRPTFKRCQPVETEIPAPGFTNELYNDFVDNLNHGCKLLPGNNVEFMSEDETILYDNNDTIRHGLTIKQVCGVDKDDIDKHHQVKCNNGTWSPNVKACPNADCDEYLESKKIQSGQIKSPESIDGSFRNSICNFHFHLEESEKVRVTFQEFEILSDEPDNKCGDSYLEYKSKENGGKLVRLCGKSLPPRIEESGPELVITLNTLNADVINFVAAFEFIKDVVTCQPPSSIEYQYEPVDNSYEVNDTLVVWCQDETKYLIGSKVWVCREDGQWSEAAECVPYEGCDLLELNGVTYDLDNEEELVSGTLEHGHIAVVYKTCGSEGTDEGLDSYITMECDNGTLSEDIVACPEVLEDEQASNCLPPSMTGVTFSHVKDIYNADDVIHITGCSDALLVPVGVSELVCDDTGSWVGSVQCVSYCENGIIFFEETEYSFFNRRSDIVYKQLNDIDTLAECQERCFGLEEFVCRSAEYREDKSACVLTNTAPNDEQFTAVNSDTKSSVIYELSCDDRCSIPRVIPVSVVYADASYKEYVPNQQVISGTVVTVICKRTFTSRKITCMGGQWDEILLDDFC